MDKVSVVGAGHVGATTALLIAQKRLGDVWLVDIVEGRAKGTALDISQAMAAQGIAVAVEGTSDFKDVAESALIIITAGFPRGPGMSRADLLEKNAGVTRQIVPEIKKRAPLATIMVVTNPVDEMACLTYQLSELARTTVFGMGALLDSARFTHFISKRLKVSPKDVSAMVIGLHNDQMLPLTAEATVNDVPLKELMPPSEIDSLVERTRQGGTEVISHLKEGSAFYAPAAAVARMAEAVMLDTHAVLPASVYLKGEYGLSEVCMSVPVRLGCHGIEEFVELPLSDAELDWLKQSAEQFRESFALIGDATVKNI